RQNRVLNVTILIGPHSRTRIPVSCVERGRWSYVSPEFRSEDRMMFARGRAAKMAQVSESLRRMGSRRSDQGRVWEAVAQKAAAFSATTRTGAMSDVYAHAARDIDSYRGAFHPTTRQVGAVFAVDGHAVGVELFDAPRTFAVSLGKLVASYALDALEHQGSPPGSIPAVKVAQEMLRRVATLRYHEAPSVGQGTELRLEGPGLAGSAIVWGDRLLHLSVLEHELESGEEPHRKGAAA
ncbi:MAG TPA: DUF6569 family protein, partial [Myxococcaceae bacterium]|nr:DUF6569 family protein [Myxococcaceae bacterium]